MIARTLRLAVTRQATLLGLSRASLYYMPRAVPAGDLALMRRIDELHLELSFAGSRMLRDLLRGEGFVTGRDHVRTLMRRMGISAVHRRPRTSQRHRAHPVFPYLLRTLTVDRPNQVWAAEHHLHPDGPRLRVPRRSDGLGHPQGPRLARLDDAHQ